MQAYRARPERRAPAQVKVKEYRRRSIGAWFMLAASGCPALGLMLVELGGFMALAILGAALGALGAWWFTIPFHAEPRVAAPARWTLRVTSLAVLGLAMATIAGSEDAAPSLLVAAMIGSLLKLVYLRVYFVAHSHAKARTAGLALVADGASAVCALLGLGLAIQARDLAPMAVVLGVVAFVLYSAAWVTSSGLVLAAARAARLSRVEWWLCEDALPDRDWAALVWHGIETARVFESDGKSKVFASAYDAINWLSARSYVDVETAVNRQLVTVQEIPPATV